MADVPEPTYITEDELKEQTLIAGIKALTPAERIQLLEIAEDQIDAFVGPQRHHPCDDNLNRVFPREEDYQRTNLESFPDYPEIPYKVSRACLRQVEHLYLQWWPVKDTEALPVEHDVTQESVGGDGSYSYTKAAGGVDFSSATLCNEAKSLLRGFVSRMVGIDTTDPCINSRFLG